MNKIMQLTGCSVAVAGVILQYLDYAAWVGALISLTGIGLTAAGAIIAYRIAIKKVLWSAGKAAAIQL